MDADKIAGRSDAANLDKLAEHLSSFKKTEDVRNSKELQEWLRQLGKQFGAEATEKWEFKTNSDVADSLSKLNESIFQKTARTVFGKPGTITVREIDAALSKTPEPPEPKNLPLSDESPFVSPIARAPNGIQLTSSTLLEIGGDGLLTSQSLDLLAHRLERGMKDGTVNERRIKAWMLDKGDNGLGLSEANFHATMRRLLEFMDKRMKSA